MANGYLSRVSGLIVLIGAGLLWNAAGAQNRTDTPHVRREMKNVSYGPHARNVMNVWLAASDKPTPVLVSIHGGGFRQGKPAVSGGLRDQCLAAGISVVAITYRFSTDAIAPASFHDGARAVQFIRANAAKWNINPDRIAATGSSAGAGISLWLAFHNDLADPKNSDPVLRQSSRLTCAAVTNGQSSYDPRFIRDLLPGTPTYKIEELELLFGVDSSRLDELPAEKYKLFEECSAITHLTRDDPPVRLMYRNAFDAPVANDDIGIHHAKFGIVLKEKMDALGIACELYAAGKDQHGRREPPVFEFIARHLLGSR